MTKEQNIVRYSAETMPPDRTDWERVLNMTEEEIDQNALDDPDNPPWTEEDWKRARLVISLDDQHKFIAVDKGLVAWFRDHEGDDPQARINEVLRNYVKRKKKRDAA